MTIEHPLPESHTPNINTNDELLYRLSFQRCRCGGYRTGDKIVKGCSCKRDCPSSRAMKYARLVSRTLA